MRLSSEFADPFDSDSLDKLSDYSAFKIMYHNFKTVYSGESSINDPESKDFKRFFGKIRYCHKNNDFMNMAIGDVDDFCRNDRRLLERYQRLLVDYYVLHLYEFRDDAPDKFKTLDNWFLKKVKRRYIYLAKIKPAIKNIRYITLILIITLLVYSAFFIYGYYDNKDKCQLELGYEISTNKDKVYLYNDYISFTYNPFDDSVEIKEQKDPGYLEYSAPIMLLASVTKYSYTTDITNLKTIQGWKIALKHIDDINTIQSNFKGKGKIISVIMFYASYLVYRQGATYAQNLKTYQFSTIGEDSIRTKIKDDDFWIPLLKEHAL